MECCRCQVDNIKRSKTHTVTHTHTCRNISNRNYLMSTLREPRLNRIKSAPPSNNFTLSNHPTPKIPQWHSIHWNSINSFQLWSEHDIHKHTDTVKYYKIIRIVNTYSMAKCQIPHTTPNIVPLCHVPQTTAYPAADMQRGDDPIRCAALNIEKHKCMSGYYTPRPRPRSRAYSKLQMKLNHHEFHQSIRTQSVCPANNSFS